MELAESLLVEAVPDVDKAVAATRRKCVVSAVEGDGIYRVDLLNSINLKEKIIWFGI